MTIWLTILGMALVTYAARATTMLALRGDVAPWLRRWLSYVPVAMFTALILPPLLLIEHDGAKALSLGPALPAGLRPSASATPVRVASSPSDSASTISRTTKPSRVTSITARSV